MEFDVLLIVAAFGGGIIGAYIGALPSFIMTGCAALAGGVAAMAGAADLAVGNIAFGALLGPQCAFLGGVAAAAFAGRTGKLENGADICSPIFGLNDAASLIVGGVFGALGMALFQIITGFGVPTDGPGCTIVILSLVIRFAFGKKGLTGKYENGEERVFFSGGTNGLLANIVMGLGISIAVSLVAASMVAAGADETCMLSYPIAIFGLAAITLVFTQTGFACPATHHIAYPAACAAVWSGNPVMGIIFGVVGAILGDFFANTINSHVDTHIDPPATTIMILICAATLMFK